MKFWVTFFIFSYITTSNRNFFSIVLLSAIPLVGNDIVFLLWGVFTIDDATLHRFYSLHFFLPFIILALSIVHISLLHEAGSTNPTGVPSMLETIPFTPYFILKDILS